MIRLSIRRNLMHAIVLLPIGLYSTAGEALGVIRVVRYSLSLVPETNPAEYSSGVPFTVTVGNNHSYVRIYSTNRTSENIGHIILNGSGSNTVQIVLGDQPWNINGVVTAACVDWDGIATNRSNIQFIGKISGNLTDTASTGQIWRLDIGGEIRGGIQGNELGGTFFITGSKITSTGNITAAVGDVGLVQIAGNIEGLIESASGNITTVTTSNGGALLADVLALQGGIGTIDIAGSIGTSGSMRDITAMDGIGTIDAHAIYANITANLSGSGNIGRITTNDHNLDPDVHDGVFAGELHANLLQNNADTVGMSIDGDCSAAITLSSLLRDDVTINGSLSGNLSCLTVSSVGGQDQPIIEVTGDLAANISLVTSGMTPSDLVGMIKVDGDIAPGKSITVTGTCYGEIHAHAVAGAINVQNNLQFNPNLPTTQIHVASISAGGSITVGDASTDYTDAPIQVDGDVASGGSISVRRLKRYVDHDWTISIGGSLLGSLTCVNSAGLEGQIVINTNNSSGGWTGPVTVGSITLDDGSAQPNMAPYYQLSSSDPAFDLGGGAVGLAPFHLYESDCAPANNSYMTRQTFEANGAIVRYYGPVEVGNPLTQPIVQMRDPYDFSNWGDCSTMFSVVVNPTPVDASERSVKVCYIGTAGDLGLGWYRLHLRTGGLLCSDVTGSPDAVGDYYFTIGINCNDSPGGVIDSGDFIDADDPDLTWDPDVDCNRNRVLDECEVTVDGEHTDRDHSGVPDDCEIGPCQCDFNDDDVLNSQDFFDFLNCFFAISCPPGRTADYNNDGFENSQDFFDFLNCFFSSCG